jgi:O-antigen/teichoic acid export membrane protein
MRHSSAGVTSIGSRVANQSNYVLLLNAGALTVATLINSGLGFVYWWIASRLYDVPGIGLATTAISVINLLSLFGDFGLGTLVAGESQRRPAEAPRLISAAVLTSLVISGTLGLAYFITALFWPSEWGQESGFLILVLTVINVPLQTANVVIDASLVGTLQSHLRLYRNVMCSVVKLILINAPIFVFINSGYHAFYILFTWLLAQIGGTLGLALIMFILEIPIWHSPNFQQLTRTFPKALRYQTIDIVAAAPALLLPIIISRNISIEKTGPFWIAWMMLNTATIVPASLASVLFTVCSADSAQLKIQLKFSLYLSLTFGAIASIVFLDCSTRILRMINPIYPVMIGLDLNYLGLSVLFTAVKYHYIAISRLNGSALSGAANLGFFALLEIGFAYLGAGIGGLGGLVVGWVIALFVESICLLPALTRALFF